MDGCGPGWLWLDGCLKAKSENFSLHGFCRYGNISTKSATFTYWMIVKNIGIKKFFGDYGNFLRWLRWIISFRQNSELSLTAQARFLLSLSLSKPYGRKRCKFNMSRPSGHACGLLAFAFCGGWSWALSITTSWPRMWPIISMPTMDALWLLFRGFHPVCA